MRKTLGTLDLRRAASRGFSLSTLIPQPTSLIPLNLAIHYSAKRLIIDVPAADHDADALTSQAVLER